MMNAFKNIFFAGTLLLIVTAWSGCKKFVEPRVTNASINEVNVYQADATAIAVLNGIYSRMFGSVFSGSSGVSLLAGLSADEFNLAGAVTDQRLLAYYRNQLQSTPNANYGTDLWAGAGGLYGYIFTCNAAIEGLTKSQSLSPAVKNQLLGEAKFLRAFYFFYLVGFYGDAVLSLSTDPNINASLPRSTKDDVYAHIVKDLKDAQNLLSSFFPDVSLLRSTAERVRPTKWAATALLARTYLYMGQWANAEAEATKIIGNTSQFSLAAINGVFLKNSSEAIWQLQPVQLTLNTADALVFVLPSSGPNASGNPVYLNPLQVTAFEAEDKRRKAGGWVDSVKSGSITYYYPAKYRATITSGANFTEYQMMFRLAEQYLIRAEARARQNNVQGARDDLNVIRSRAGLQGTAANDVAGLLTAILQERRVELFTEMGQRWLDLKRTGNIDAVMSVVTPLKAAGNGWQTYQQWYPIFYRDIQINPSLLQNSGY